MYDANFYAHLQKEEEATDEYIDQRGTELEEQRQESEDYQRECDQYPAEGNIY